LQRYSHDVHPISDAVLTEQQKIADVFFDLKLIPKPIQRQGRGPEVQALSKDHSMQVFWFIPTHGDSRYLGTTQGARVTNHAYFKQIAQAADALGYDGVLIPPGGPARTPGWWPPA